jgi:hypothetical protein
LTLGATTLSVGSTTSLRATVSNLGTATAQSVAVAISLVGGATTSQVAQINVGTLSAGASGTVAATLTAPMSPGTYTVIASATTPDAEANTANNTATTMLGVSTSTTSTSTTSPTTYYVSKSGNDANSCATAQSASPETNHKLTVNAGLACLRSAANPNAGHTLNIGPGIYSETILATAIPSGANSASPTIIRSRVRRAAELRAPSSAACSSNSNAMIVFRLQSHVRIEQMDINPNGLCQTNVRFYDSTLSSPTPTDIELYDNLLRNILGQANVVAGTNHIVFPTFPNEGRWSDVRVRYNEITGTVNYGNGGMSLDCDQCLAEYNYVHDVKLSGIGIHHAANITGTIIRNNWVENTGGSCLNFSGNNNLMYNNVAINCSGGLQGGQEPGGTLIHNEAAIFMVRANNLGTTTNNGIYNNTIYNPRGSLGCIRIASSAGSPHFIRNNICYGGSNTIMTNTGDATFSNNRCGSGCTTAADPLFVNAAAYDFNLQANSPMINAGMAITAVAEDYLGVTRPQDSGVDLGAFEFVP